MARARRRPAPDVVYGAWIEGIGWVDSAWIEDGLPTCRWHRAPAGVATRRQLRELGLAPGGHPPVAALRRRPGGRLRAWLYRLDVASFKRQATPAVRRALAAAMRARRTCPSCARDTGCCVPRSLGQCWDCHLLAPARFAARHDETPARVVGGGGA
jgi:hypothetical protein